MKALLAVVPKLILIPVAIGIFGGLIAALCGVGGGIVMVPAFVYFLGMDQKAAVATSMAVIAPTAAMAIFKFTGNGLVEWKIMIPTAIGAIVAAYFGADYMKSLSNDVLTKIFAGVLILIGVLMLFAKAK